MEEGQGGVSQAYETWHRGACSARTRSHLGWWPGRCKRGGHALNALAALRYGGEFDVSDGHTRQRRCSQRHRGGQGPPSSVMQGTKAPTRCAGH